MSKERKFPLIDLLETWCRSRGATKGREQLLAAIMCGDILVAGERCRDPKRMFPKTILIETTPTSPLAQDFYGCNPLTKDSIPTLPFVSRGGDKLDSLFQTWKVAVADRIWLDAGCSTGGFTHCLLLRKAALVHAVDVGYNVLDWRLRNLPQILVHERCNIMGIEKLEPQPDAAVADLSFRSMQGAAKKILSLLSGNELYALIKPQFERKYRLPENREITATQLAKSDFPSETNFSGVVDAEECRLILDDVAQRLAGDGIRIGRIGPAGLRGRSGNQEYIAQLSLDSPADFQRLASANRRIVAEMAD